MNYYHLVSAFADQLISNSDYSNLNSLCELAHKENLDMELLKEDILEYIEDSLISPEDLVLLEDLGDIPQLLNKWCK